MFTFTMSHFGASVIGVIRKRNLNLVPKILNVNFYQSNTSLCISRPYRNTEYLINLLLLTFCQGYNASGHDSELFVGYSTSVHDTLFIVVSYNPVVIQWELLLCNLMQQCISIWLKLTIIMMFYSTVHKLHL